MLTEAVLLAAISLANKMLDVVILTIQDQPKEERVKAWKRWFKFWDPIWKGLGLDVTMDPFEDKK